MFPNPTDASKVIEDVISYMDVDNDFIYVPMSEIHLSTSNLSQLRNRTNRIIVCGIHLVNKFNAKNRCFYVQGKLATLQASMSATDTHKVIYIMVR